MLLVTYPRREEGVWRAVPHPPQNAFVTPSHPLAQSRLGRTQCQAQQAGRHD